MIVAVFQYRFRRIGMSIILYGVGLTISALVAFFYPRSIKAEVPDAARIGNLGKIQFSLGEISTYTSQNTAQNGTISNTPTMGINATLHYTNAGPYYPIAKFMRGKLSYPNKLSRSLFNTYYTPTSPWISKQQLTAIRNLLPEWEILFEAQQERMTIKLAELPANEFESIQNEPGEYSGQASVQWIEYHLLGQMPLRLGAQWNGGGYQVNIRSLQPQYGLVTHNGNQSNYLCGVTLNLENYYMADYLKKETVPSWGYFGNLRFVIGDPQSRKILVSNGYGGSAMHFSPLSGLKVDNQQITFNEQHVLNRPMHINNDWFVSGVVLIFELKPSGTLIHEVHEKDIVLNRGSGL